MDVFKHNIKFTNWGQVYVGIKEGWLTVELAVQYFQQDYIPYSEDRDAYIYLALEHSHFEFLEQIKKFIVEDGGAPIVKKEETIDGVRYYYPTEFPIEYYDIWEVELMLRIHNTDLNKEAKLYRLNSPRTRDLFPIWIEKFWYAIIYMPGNGPATFEELYDVFEKYMYFKLKQLQAAQ